MPDYRQLIIITTLISSLGVTSAATQNFESMPIKIKMTNGHNKIIQLVAIPLSKNTRRIISDNTQIQIRQPKIRRLIAQKEVAKVELGMNDVPVLDQGVWGTCATFAATAAINAYLNLKEGQAVSQLCNLALGRAIKNPDKEGGWDGSSGHLVLNQISHYGFLNKSFQHDQGCGGLNHYPRNDSSENGESMDSTDFSAISDKSFTYHNWNQILKYEDEPDLISTLVGSRILAGVKKALLSKHRVVYGTLLVPFIGQAGALGSYNNVKNDTWVLTPEITKKIKAGIIAGHEMVITGFDDAACATYVDAEKEEQEQCGLLHLRNSWSKYSGDEGDYYVTYDYFKTMTIEAYEVGDAVH